MSVTHYKHSMDRPPA